jgi:hypothetical protein
MSTTNESNEKLYVLDHLTHSFDADSIKTSPDEMVALMNVVFGSFPVKGQVFYATRLTIGLVNLKPISLGREFSFYARLDLGIDFENVIGFVDVTYDPPG